jgi:nucleoid DNA-binding protein
LKQRDFVAAISDAAKLTPNKTRLALKKTLGILSNALNRGDWIQLRGFGTIYLRSQAAYLTRNPNTGGTLLVKRKKVVKFRQSAEFNEF